MIGVIFERERQFPVCMGFQPEIVCFEMSVLWDNNVCVCWCVLFEMAQDSGNHGEGWIDVDSFILAPIH